MAAFTTSTESPSRVTSAVFPACCAASERSASSLITSVSRSWRARAAGDRSGLPADATRVRHCSYALVRAARSARAFSQAARRSTAAARCRAASVGPRMATRKASRRSGVISSASAAGADPAPAAPTPALSAALSAAAPVARPAAASAAASVARRINLPNWACAADAGTASSAAPRAAPRTVRHAARREGTGARAGGHGGGGRSGERSTLRGGRDTAAPQVDGAKLGATAYAGA
jgi:hypothetical protein